MKVKVTEYKNYMVIETLEPDKDDNFIPVGGNQIGCTLKDTEKYLGISEEALKFMKGLEISGDDIGEVGTWMSKGKGYFSWIGPIKRLVGPNVTLSNTGFQDVPFIKIRNDVSKEAREAIDKK